MSHVKRPQYSWKPILSFLYGGEKHHYTILVNNNNKPGTTILFQEVLVLYIYINELCNRPNQA